MAAEAAALGIPPYIGQYRIEAKLGAGYSGSIWRASHIYRGNLVALKVQHINHECPTNRYERGFYPALQGGLGMPTMWDSGIEGEWDWLAIDLLGPSLDSMFRSSGKDTFDLRTVCCVAQQIISRLETMHSRGVLHRDIQLGNCTVGLSPNNTTLYMIDFGFSKKYIDPYTNRHIPDSTKKRDFIGNYWFSSVAVHCKGKVPSRRDDLEAAALMLIHMLTPRGLPWTRNGVPKTEEAHDHLKWEKQHARPADLCRGLPREFEEFLRYCRRLKFMDCPDYDQWIDEFKNLAEDCGFGDDDAIIWPPPPIKKPAPLKPPRRSLGPPPGDLDSILNGLGNMNLAERPVLGDRKNIDEAVRRARRDIFGSNTNVVEISEGSSLLTGTTNTRTDLTESHLSPPPKVDKNAKAHRLRKLAAQISHAMDNQTLANLVDEFVAALQMNKSRTLTKDGFTVLDALYRQLEDPSVVVQPLRAKNARENSEQDPGGAGRLGVIASLRREVRTAISNKALASMISDFGKLTNKSSGRTVTKDGFAFLAGVAARLRVL